MEHFRFIRLTSFAYVSTTNIVGQVKGTRTSYNKRDSEYNASLLP
ncbi:hypothetical protein HID58_081334 [Brassica napus]|uniref:Uncharacterized protein n=1 Tax=Brassica napus TaxID=3708 RepID=A0ABQ7Y7E5_BRANA|nr:hypothetical protein HID58_081334 [Brassica napus]